MSKVTLITKAQRLRMIKKAHKNVQKKTKLQDRIALKDTRALTKAVKKQAINHPLVSMLSLKQTCITPIKKLNRISKDLQCTKIINQLHHKMITNDVY